MAPFRSCRSDPENFRQPQVVLLQVPGWGVATPPLSLALLSGFLRSHGYKVLPLDLNVEHYANRTPDYQQMWEIDIGQPFWNNFSLVDQYVQAHRAMIDQHVAAIVETGAPLVAFSLYNSCLRTSLHYARLIRERSPGTRIVFGGPHASRYMAARYILEHDFVDAAAQGEGELVLRDVVDRVAGGEPFDDLKGLIVRRDGRMADNGDRDLIGDLDSMPFGDFSDYDFSLYRDATTLPMMSSRGCPNQCIYCSEVVYWRNYRGYSPERVVDEIAAQLKHYPFLERVEFQDSLVNGQITRLSRFADLVVERELRFRWAGQAVIRKEMTLELFQKLKSSGCECLAFGLETSSPSLMLSVGKLLAKGTEMDALVENAHAAGVSCAYNFMFGMPGETEADAQASLEFLRKHRHHVGTVNPSAAFCGFTPGTPGYEEPGRFRIVPSETTDQYWETEDGTNNLLVRLRRFEDFCRLAAELDVPTTYPHRQLLDRDRLIGGYHHHHRHWDQAIEHLDRWVRANPDDEEAAHKLEDCYRQQGRRPPPRIYNRQMAHEIISPAVTGELSRLAEAFRSAKPFPHVVIDEFLQPQVCQRLLAEFPPYDDLRFRNERGDRGKGHYENVPELGETYQRVHEYLGSSHFLRLMSEISGIPNLCFDPEYFGGGTHENLDDMELDPHVDFTRHPVSGLYRRLNLLLYLNDEWQEAWGGSLELHTNPWEPWHDETKSVLPIFNRCVIFATSHRSWHGVRTLKGNRPLSRKSFALYLYTRERPDDQPFIPSDLTVFIDRPLPPHITVGHTLSAADVKLLQRLLFRRDVKLRHLYDRAICLSNDVARLEEDKKDR
jgi:radical SAM superfamily enzyme YgiQ (UPF0313 family)